jgi:LmbE family N-acetylglucosaminyl deacetylase
VEGEELAASRRAEQRRAAEIGEYGALVQLGLPSAAVRGEGWPALVDALAGLLATARADELLTHSPADRHPTHVAVVAAAVAAARRLEASERPRRVLGGEVWGGLDWLPRDARVERDASGFLALGRRTLAAHRSQLRVTAYDRAAQGRRVANATFADPLAPGGPRALELMIDLTPAIADDGPGLAELVARTHAAAAAAAEEALARYPV